MLSSKEADSREGKDVDKEKNDNQHDVELRMLDTDKGNYTLSKKHAHYRYCKTPKR